MRACGGAHPGTDARTMHAGIVMRRMLELMRDGTAGRRGQKHHDRQDHQPDQTLKGRIRHDWKQISKVAKEASTTLRSHRPQLCVPPVRPGRRDPDIVDTAPGL